MKDINEFIAFVKDLWGADNVTVERHKQFTHRYVIKTPATSMVVFVMGDWGFNGSHQIGPYYWDNKPCTTGDRDAKTLRFFVNRENKAHTAFKEEA